MDNGATVLKFECCEPDGTITRTVRPAKLSFSVLKGYYDKLKEFDTVFNGYVANNIDAFIHSFVKSNGSGDLQSTGIIWEVDDVGILYLTDISIGNDAYAHFNFWDRRFEGRENLIRGMMSYIMKEFDLHRISVEVGLFAAPWLPLALERMGFVKEGRKRESIWFAKKSNKKERKLERAYSKKIHSPICGCKRRATMEVFNKHSERCGLKCIACGERLMESLNTEESQRTKNVELTMRDNEKGQWFDSLMYSMLRHEVEEYGT